MADGQGMKGSTPLAVFRDECLHYWATMSSDSMLYGDQSTLRTGIDQQPKGPWQLHTKLDGRPMVIEIEVERDDLLLLSRICGHRSIERYWECRMPDRHDGPHVPFTKEVLAVQPNLVVTSIRSECPNEGVPKFYRQEDGSWRWIRGIEGFELR